MHTLLQRIKSSVVDAVRSIHTISSPVQLQAEGVSRLLSNFFFVILLLILVYSFNFQIRVFCNVFRVYPSNRLDSLSLKLVVANFLLDPFTYVLFKKNFKRNLKQSITELTEFIGDGSFSQRLKKQSSRDNNGNKKENSSRVGHGQFAKTSMFQDDKPTLRIVNLDTAA